MTKLGAESEDMPETKIIEQCWGYNFYFDRFQYLVANFEDNWTAMFRFRKRSG
jgi:hypothetical protein